jgi:sterol desaturase/sphingolipid hydroxylase (fatty acid hydroxylase superfamily)
MPAYEFLTNITIILAIMGVLALLETLVPMFAADPRQHDRRAANLGLTTLTFVSNWLLASLAAVAALALQPTGLMARLGWPAWIEILIGILIVDFSAGYLSHRTMHMWPVMWRFHRIHHSDPFVDVTTTFRTHPIEAVWRFVFAMVPVWIFGIPAQAVLIQRLLQATNAVIEHANIRLPARLDRVLSLVWVTPNVHKIHHSRAVAETNSNYANVLTLYDRLLGTYTPAERAASVVYGLDDVDPVAVASFPAILSMPFHTSAAPEVPDTKVRIEGSVGQ